jgi:hypothetical protein
MDFDKVYYHKKCWQVKIEGWWWITKRCHVYILVKMSTHSLPSCIFNETFGHWNKQVCFIDLWKPENFAKKLGSHTSYITLIIL